MDIRGYSWQYLRRMNVWISSVISTLLMKLVCILKGVSLGRNPTFTGLTRIRRYPDSTICIGETCRFNSSRNSVRIGLFKPCALVTLRKNARIELGEHVGCTSVTLAAANSIVIGNNVLLGANVFIMDTDWHNTNPDERQSFDIISKPVIIENGVFIGYNSVVLKGVTIGENSVIAANSLVMSNIPPNSIAMGNPCKVILKRNWDTSSDV